MKPLVSAAAAALLLVGGRRSGGAPPNPTPHTPPPDDDDDDHSTLDTDVQTETTLSNHLSVKRFSIVHPKLTILDQQLQPHQWDWSNPPDDSSIWTATAAVLGGAWQRAKDVREGVGGVKEPKDAIEVLSAALRGLKVFAGSDHRDDEGMRDRDSDSGYDVRPLIAVTIGVTLFLLTRTQKLSRRVEVVEEPDDSRQLDYSVVSDLRGRCRDIVIVTTAALPWMTGTAVNPVLRAVYLAKRGHHVTLVVPWLESETDQRTVYPGGVLFHGKEEQREVIHNWIKEHGESVEVCIRFYEGVYSKEFGSILPLGDITSMFGGGWTRDVCVLEEPEHLTWHHTGARWTSLFRFVVGVVHTNYLEYAKKHGVFGPQRALFLSFLNKWVCRSYCHRVIKLSDAVQTLPHSVTSNVHGVRDRFIDIGKGRAGKPFENGAYFLGKVLWAKGYRQLVDLMDEHFARTEERLPIDFFGAGPDLDAVRRRVADSYGLSLVQIHGLVVDHASEYLQRYKVYVNPSKSDVVCTATAEALAMGKFVVCLKHPSNEFFSTFDNCLIYETPEQFSAQLAYALANEPKPLSEEDAFRLSWEAATERFYDASFIPSPPAGRGVDSALALTHKTICSTLVTPPADSAVRERYRLYDDRCN